MTDESLATQANRVWAGSRKTRDRIAAGLAIPGALLWLMQALGAWIQSQEGKWQNTAYLSLGDSTITADNLLALLGVAFLHIAALLGIGAILLLRGRPSGRYLVLTGSALVVLGQVFAAVLAAIPIDAFSTSAPADLVFATPLVIFPVATIACLINSGRHES